MKYLKVFENFEEYFSEISMIEFDEVVFDQWMDIKGPDEVLAFNESEIEYLKNICERDCKIKYKYRRALTDHLIKNGADDIVQIRIDGSIDRIDGGTIKEKRKLKKSQSRDEILIYKLPDEWYYIEAWGIGSTWYKCDQLSGIKKWIETNIKIKNTNEIADECDGVINYLKSILPK